MTIAGVLPSVNAALNATSGVLLVLGFRAIRAGHRERHRALMLAAFASSTLFLAAYLTRIALTGTTRSRGRGHFARCTCRSWRATRSSRPWPLRSCCGRSSWRSGRASRITAASPAPRCPCGCTSPSPGSPCT